MYCLTDSHFRRQLTRNSDVGATSTRHCRVYTSRVRHAHSSNKPAWDKLWEAKQLWTIIVFWSLLTFTSPTTDRSYRTHQYQGHPANVWWVHNTLEIQKIYSCQRTNKHLVETNSMDGTTRDLCTAVAVITWKFAVTWLTRKKDPRHLLGVSHLWLVIIYDSVLSFSEINNLKLNPRK